MFKQIDIAGFVDASEEDLPAVAGYDWVIQCCTERPVTGHGFDSPPLGGTA
jgi:hypothetical protein